MSSIVHVCGWECGLAIGGTSDSHYQFAQNVSISTTVTRGAHSARSLKIGNTGAASYMRRFAATSQTEYAGRIYLYVEAWPTATMDVIQGTVAAGAKASIQVDSSTRELEVQIGGDVNAVARPGAISLNTWYRIDFAFFCGTNGYAKMSVDGGTTYQSNTTQTATTFDNGFRVGTSASDATFIAYVDDFTLSDAVADFPIGAGKVEGVVPNADGSHSFTTGDFKYDNSGNVATNATDTHIWVDDIPLGSTADFLTQNVINGSGFLEFAFASTSVAPRALQAIVQYATASTTTDNITFKLRDSNGGTEDNIFSGDPSTTASFTDTPDYKQKTYTTIPGTANAWTINAYNGLRFRFGFSSDTNPVPGIHAVMLEVDFPESGATTQNGSFTADSILRKATTGNVTVDAILRKVTSTTFTADAFLTASSGFTFTADAILKKAASATITANAILRTIVSGTFAANAVLAAAPSGSAPYRARDCS